MAKQTDNQQASPAAAQLREAFDEIQTLKSQIDVLTAERDHAEAESKKLADRLQVAIARVVLLEQNGATVGPVSAVGKDGSMTIPITLDADLVPSLRAQYEGMGQIGVSFEEFIKTQIIGEAISMYQGNL